VLYAVQQRTRRKLRECTARRFTFGKRAKSSPKSHKTFWASIIDPRIGSMLQSLKYLLSAEITKTREFISFPPWPPTKSISCASEIKSPHGKRFFGANFSQAPPAVDEFIRRDGITGFPKRFEHQRPNRGARFGGSHAKHFERINRNHYHQTGPGPLA